MKKNNLKEIRQYNSRIFRLGQRVNHSCPKLWPIISQKNKQILEKNNNKNMNKNINQVSYTPNQGKKLAI